MLVQDIGQFISGVVSSYTGLISFLVATGIAVYVVLLAYEGELGEIQ